MDLETIIELILIVNILWCCFFSIYFVLNRYTSYKVHLLSCISLLSNLGILFQMDDMLKQNKLLIIIFLSFILIVSLGRQIYLFYRHRYIVNIDKVLKKFAKKYNVSNFTKTNNFDFKDLVEKANEVFNDKTSTIYDKYLAVKVLSRIAKTSEMITKYKEITGRDINQK